MAFDPYQKWLGIPPEEQPPSYYRLLGIRNFEDDPDVIESAADRMMAFLRDKGGGPRAADSQRLLNEVSNARLKLLKPETKRSYDRTLKEKLNEASQPAPPTPSVNLRKPALKAPPVSVNSPRSATQPATRPLLNTQKNAASARRSRKQLRHIGIAIGIVAGAISAVLLMYAGGRMMGGGESEGPRAESGEPEDNSSRRSQVADRKSNVSEKSKSRKVAESKSQRAEDSGQRAEDSDERLEAAGDESKSQTSRSGEQRAKGEEPEENGSRKSAIENRNSDGTSNSQPSTSNSSPTSNSQLATSNSSSPSNSEGDPFTKQAPTASESGEEPENGNQESKIKNQKSPVPNAAAVRAKQAELQEIYQREFSQAKMPPEKIELAKTMLARAEQIDQPTIDRYVFLRTAAQLAGESGDGTTSLAAIGLLDEDFEVDALQMKTDVAVKSGKILRHPEHNRGLAQFVAQLVDQAVEAERFELIDELRVVGLSAAHKARDGRLVNQLGARLEQIKPLEAAYNKAAGAIQRLRFNPDDAEANLLAGRYYCFAKGDFEKGLPMLARCSDERFSSVAKADLAEPESAEKQVELADAWLSLAESERDKEIKPRIGGRAAYWYGQALPELKGLAKAAVEKKVAELGDVPTGGGKVVDGDVALAVAGAKAHGGFERATGPKLIDGDNNVSEYCYAEYPCEWIVKLADTFSLREVRLRLYDKDKRFYQYTIETSVDGTNYNPLVDRSMGEWQSWQVIEFTPRPVRFIRIRGLHNSANQYFHAVELEAYCKPNPNPPPK